MLQGWYWDYPKPGCNGYTGSTWASTLNSQANQLDRFSHVWLPPFSRASFGSCSNGYDPKDLYDLGEYGLGATGFGTRTEVDNLITTFQGLGIDAVADVVYNHRDGGATEDNPAVKSYIETHMAPGKNPFPSDRYNCYLPIGGSTGLGAGEYYFKLSSKTGNFGSSHQYNLYMTTTGNPGPFLGTVSESEPNGGGDCGQPFDTIQLNQDMTTTLGDFGTDGMGNPCRTDEFLLILEPSDFVAGGDTIDIFMRNIAGGYSDHRIYDIYYQPAAGGSGFSINLSELKYVTYTDFTNMPSGQGAADYNYFKPNDNNASTTFLSGDWDQLFFFYDYDQYQPQVGTLLSDWTDWLWTDVGIRGYRMDAVKHFDPAFVGTALSGVSPDIAVGEFFDSNPTVLKNWVDDANSGSATTIQVFDFHLREALKQACEGASGYDVRNVFNSGVVDAAGGTGFRTVTFMNNHDFRTNLEYAKGDLMLGYAYLLTNNKVGLPCVFYPDYFGVDLGYYQPPALKADIDELIDLHEQHIFGASQVDYLNRFSTPYGADYFNGCQDRALIYQISGGPSGLEVIVAINFCDGSLKVDHVINTFGAPSGTVFDDVLGNSNFATATVSGNGHPLPNSIYIDLPPNSYSVWVEQPSALPIELIDFRVSRADGGALLEWESATEVNFEGYELQRSEDGRAFTPIAWVEGQGGQTSAAYRYLDKGLQSGRTYVYRLKMLDWDGSYEYSPQRSLRMPGFDPQLQLFPNPAGESLSMSWQGDKVAPWHCRLLDAQGKTVREWTVQSAPGRQTERVETNGLPNGLYVLQVQGEREVIAARRFVKQ